MAHRNGSLDAKAERASLDWQAVWRSSLAPFIVWAALVILVSFVERQPGVVCITPVAWVLGCWVGMACVARSRSASRPALLKEAGVAGAALGFLQGILFIVITAFLTEIKPDEWRKAIFMWLAMLFAGTLITAVVSVAVGAAQARRRRAQ
ncbi:MAG: hypothetical protein M3348_11150 [Acidobacteriota bacterium]|nr:hypothetical protein [Acidobacteriota bacterium]